MDGYKFYNSHEDSVSDIRVSDFIFDLIRAIGMILLGFGIVQIGLSLKSHDPSQRANGFMTLAGGSLSPLRQIHYRPTHKWMFAVLETVRRQLNLSANESITSRL